MIHFTKKLKNSTTFNLTETGRAILLELSKLHGISAGDTVENLVSFYHGPLPNIKSAKFIGPRGGAPSLFPGKDRGKTTAITLTANGKFVLDSQVKLVGVSRGDWIELLLRQTTNTDFGNQSLSDLFTPVAV